MTDYKKQSKTNSKLEVKCEYENSSFNECSENESCFLSHGLINDNDNNNKLINKMSDHNLPNGNDVLVSIFELCVNLLFQFQLYLLL